MGADPPNNRTVPATLVWFGSVSVFFASIGYLWWFSSDYIKLEILSRVFLGVIGSLLITSGSLLYAFKSLKNQGPKTILEKFLEIFRTKKRIILAAFLVIVIIVSSGSILLIITGPIPFPQKIPLTASWQAEGPGAVGVRYENEVLVLTANLSGSDDYAALFLDITKVYLPNLEQNIDGTFNLVGKRLNATVKSEYDFIGDRDHTNGIQLTVKNVKNEKWDSIDGPWFNAGPAMNVSGMDIHYVLPDQSLTRECAGLSVKFTVGTGSNASYKGELFLHELVVTSELRDNSIYLFTFFAAFPVAIVVAAVFLWRTKPRKVVKVSSHKKRRKP